LISCSESLWLFLPSIKKTVVFKVVAVAAEAQSRERQEEEAEEVPECV